MPVHHILPYSDTAGDDIGRSKPRVLYNNFLAGDDATITTDAPVVAGYEVQNCLDYRSYTYWRVGAGTYRIRATFDAAKTVNSWAFYSTTLAAAGASIQLKYSTNGGATWTAAGAAVSPGNTVPIYKVLAAPITAVDWEVEIVTPVAVDIGVLFIGYDFQFERGCWVGFSPPRLARDTDITNVTSQAGVFLGRTIQRNGVTFDFPLDKLTPEWVETYWRPFVVHAELLPFFVLWNKSGFPNDVAYAWAERKIPVQEYSHVNFMKAGMSCRGKVE